MPRKKEYNEQEVTEKAMNLFWRNGYENTSTRMLEKEMGINQFSIYSSFGSKQGVLIESMKCYRSKLKTITDKLEQSDNGIQDIKQYFYDFIEFSKENELGRGCLITNTSTELGKDADPFLVDEILKFNNEIRGLFLNNLKQDFSKTEKTIQRETNYLIISMTALSLASKVFEPKQIDDFIETAFMNL